MWEHCVDVTDKAGLSGAGSLQTSFVFNAMEARWLGDLDSNQGCPGQSREFYR